MSNYAKRECTLSTIFKIFTLLLLLILASLFYLSYSQTMMQREYGLLEELKRSKLLYQKIEGVFEISTYHKSFDDIVEETAAFEKSIDAIGSNIMKYHSKEENLLYSNYYAELEKKYNASRRHIERYKSWNAIIINSSRFLYSIHNRVNSLILDAPELTDKERILHLHDDVTLSVTFMMYEKLTDSEQVLEKVQRLKVLVRESKALKEVMSNIQRHLQILAEGYHALQVLSDANAALDVTSSIDKIYLLLLDDFSAKDQRNIWSMYLLNGMLVVLLLVLYFVSRKESRLQKRVCELKNDLIDKVKDLEALVHSFDANVIASRTDAKGRIIYVSQAFCEISGYSADELLGKSHNIVRHFDMPVSIFKELWETIRAGKEWKGEVKNRTKDGGYYWVSVHITPELDDERNIIGYSAIRQKITSRKALEALSASLEEQVVKRTQELEEMVKQVRTLSITDALTGLYNRRYYSEVCEREIKRALRQGELFVYMLLDIDNFKKYNDTYGHQLGDAALIKVATAFRTKLKRPSDFIFRMGGEEFAIFYTCNEREKALEFAHAIIASVASLGIEHSGNAPHGVITVSAGLHINNGEQHERSENIIYRQTDTLLYRAKKQGRNRLEQ